MPAKTYSKNIITIFDAIISHFFQISKQMSFNIIFGNILCIFLF